MKNKNNLNLHIVALLEAFYAEKGYYLWVIWLLLTGDMVTTNR